MPDRSRVELTSARRNAQIKVACIQLSATRPASKSDRLKHALSMMNDPDSADLILLPELWAIGYFQFDRYVREAESLVGPTYEAVARMARELRTYILAGSIVERDSQGKLYNTSFLIDQDGTIVHVYRKIHVFGYESKETQLLTAGDSVRVSPTALGKISVSTCYDLRFPELYRLMTAQEVEIILVPSAWPRARLHHWELLTRVRALENQAFLVACNGAGNDQGTRLAGNSMIVDPWGDVVARAGCDEEILVGKLDLRLLNKVRDDFPALADRRISINDRSAWLAQGD
jgi:predicted amidohydrolase